MVNGASELVLAATLDTISCIDHRQRSVDYRKYRTLFKAASQEVASELLSDIMPGSAFSLVTTLASVRYPPQIRWRDQAIKGHWADGGRRRSATCDL